ncbi:MAG: carboxylating nicotinate-nucleotide diphosphorylase [Sulfolobaceae archaeon]|nr:carboxylating nicotinate-nucleotide diphosphorylase [Sulfolobaceae archaeon]
MSELFEVEKLFEFLKEDLYPEDITSKYFSGYKVRAVIRSKNKEDFILAGMKFVIPFLERLGLKVIEYLKDGEVVRNGQTIAVYEGESYTVLASERVVLNLLSRLSGIATATRKMVELARNVNPNVIIAGTRKTTPGLRIFEKYAIEVGGGDPHRFNLSDAILIKDNHIRIAGSVEDALKAIKGKVPFTKKVEIEVETFEDALKAYKSGCVDIILLDNMSPEEVSKVVKELKGKVLLEASGGITPENVIEYAKTGVDIISSGYLTHSVKSVDISLDVYRI